MVTILGIDVGTVNLGWAIVKDGKFLAAGVATLSKKDPLKAEIRRFARCIKRKFGKFTVVAIEKQMRGRMRVAETLLQNEFGTVAKITPPQSVKRYFNYSGIKKYKDRKVMGCRIFQNLCRECNQLQWLQRLLKGRKKMDDVADAALIAYFEFAEYKVRKLKKETATEDDQFLDSWQRDHLWCVSCGELDSLSK